MEYVPLDEVDTAAFEEALLASSYNQQADAGVSTWYPLPYAAGSGSWSEDQQDTDQGAHFRLSINTFLPADSTVVRGEINAMRHRRFLLRLTKNGTTTLIGSPERGLRFSSTFESGSEGGDNRGHRMQFSGVSLQKSPGYVPVF